MEEFYTKPDEKLKQRRFVEYKTRFIEPFFPKDTSIKILDVGCGYGLFVNTCQKLGYVNCEGVDLDRSYTNYADYSLAIKNITTSDLFDHLETKKDGHYDVITAFNIIEHIKKEKIQTLLNLIYKKITPGGIFIMEVPNADSPLGIHTFFTDLTHEFAFSRKLALRLLHIAGFDTIKVMYQPMRKNPLIKVAQKIMARIVGFEYEMMFSGNIILIGYKK